jgi:transcriptional regulator with XRE-family HTH domain
MLYLKGGECKMRFGEMARQARIDSGMSLKDAAEKLHVTRQTLSNMENEDTMPDPQNVYNMARLYNEPSLLNAHCKCNCPIGRKLNYILPNKMTKNLTAITVRNMKEAEEHVNCLKEFAFNSVTGKDSRIMIKTLKDILEAEYWIEVLIEQCIREYGIDAVVEMISQVNCVYIDEGLVCV